MFSPKFIRFFRSILGKLQKKIPLKPVSPLMGPLKSMSPGVIVPPLGGPGCVPYCHTVNSAPPIRTIKIIDRKLLPECDRSNHSLDSLYYDEACNELAGPIFASLRPGNTASFEEMSQQWRAVSNAVSDLTDATFETQISRSRDKRATVRPTNRSIA